MQFQLYLVCYTAVFRVNVAQHEINLVFQLFYAKGSGLN